MKYLVIAIVLVALGWFFFFKGQDTPASSAPSAPPSPQAQFDSLFASGIVEASKLGALCQAHPEVAAQYLKGRSFKLNGTAQDFRVSGLAGRKAEILLQTGTKRQLVIVYDLDQYEQLNAGAPVKGRYAIVDAELLRVQDGGSKQLICTRGQAVQQPVVTRNVGASIISFVAPAK